MWPFKAKYKDGGIVQQENKAQEVSQEWAAIEALQAWRGIGDEFTYLGRTCVVSGHYKMHFTGFGTWLAPGISAYYADDLGVIHNIAFSGSESTALMLRQPNGGINGNRQPEPTDAGSYEAVSR